MTRAQGVFIGCAKDLGNALALIQVLKGLKDKGCRVELLLDRTGIAAQALSDSKSSFATTVSRTKMAVTLLDPGGDEDEDVIQIKAAAANAVIVSLSTSDYPNLEINVFAQARALGRPAYGYEAVPGGRHSSGWQENALKLSKLFTCMATPDDRFYPNLRVAGPVQLESYRGKDTAAVGRAAREKLGIKQSAPVVYYTGHPNAENPQAVERIGDALKKLGPSLRSELTLIVTRHEQELMAPAWGSHANFREVLENIIATGIRVIEVSPGMPAECKCRHAMNFPELVCVCHSNGVVVTGFTNDELVIAPHLAIPSILFWPPPDKLGRQLRQEKQSDAFPFLDLPQVVEAAQLEFFLREFLTVPGVQKSHCDYLRQTYPFPQVSAVQCIVQEMLG